MNTSQAITALRKIIGPKAMLRDHRKPSSQEQRDIAREQRRTVIDAKKLAEAAMVVRRNKVLAADEQHQGLLREYMRLQDILNRLPMSPYFRYEALKDHGWARSIVMGADNLAELVEKVEHKRNEVIP